MCLISHHDGIENFKVLISSIRYYYVKLYMLVPDIIN